MSQNNFENWYRNNFKGLSEEPPESVWENVSAQLDTDKVWNNINSELNRKENRKRRFAILFVFFLLAGLGWLVLDPINNISPNDLVNETENSGHDKNTQPESFTKDNSEAAEKNSSGDEKTSSVATGAVVTQEDHSVVVTLNPSETPKNSPVNREKTVTAIHQDEPAFVTSGSKPVFLFFPSVNSLLTVSGKQPIHELSQLYLSNPSDSTPKENRNYLATGVSAVGSYSGLINPQSVHALTKNTTNSVSFLPDLAMETFAEAIIHGRFGIGGFACWPGSVQQVYHGYHEGQYTSNELRVVIFKTGIYSSWYFDNRKNHEGGPQGCLTAGVTGNFITRKSYSGTSGEYYDPKNLVAFYPGFVVGARKYKAIFPGWYIHGGINIEGSITNVYAGEPGVPRDFFRTHVVTIAGSAGISYRFNLSTR